MILKGQKLLVSAVHMGKPRVGELRINSKSENGSMNLNSTIYIIKDKVI